MDLSVLSQNIVIFLAPFLPYLVKSGEQAIEEIGKQFGIDTWKQAKALWGKLHPKVNARPIAQGSVQELAKSPDDEDARTILRDQLKKLLTEDDVFAQEIAQLMKSQVVQHILAERGSSVRDVEQTVTGGKEVRQDVIARDNSIIEGVRQRKQ